MLEDAPIRNIHIMNLTLPKNRPIRCGPAHAASAVTFLNLVMDGKLIKDASKSKSKVRNRYWI